jgi:hypothetical protein
LGRRFEDLEDLNGLKTESQHTVRANIKNTISYDQQRTHEGGGKKTSGFVTHLALKRVVPMLNTLAASASVRRATEASEALFIICSVCARQREDQSLPSLSPCGECTIRGVDLYSHNAQQVRGALTSRVVQSAVSVSSRCNSSESEQEALGSSLSFNGSSTTRTCGKRSRSRTSKEKRSVAQFAMLKPL